MPSLGRSRGRSRPVGGLALNGKWLSQGVTGTQRYAMELTHHLARCHPGKLVVHVPKDAEVPTWLEELASVRHSRLSGTTFEQVALPWHSRSQVLLNLGGPAPILARRQVVTMHDASVFRFSHTYSWAFGHWYRLMYRVLARRALAVLTVSQFSAHDLAEVLKVPRSRFTVVPNGADHVDAVVPRRPAMALPDGSWVLCVGTLAKHKNLEPTVVALTSAGVDVVVVGAAGASRVFGAGHRPSLGKAIVSGRLGDDELAWLYQHAEALVFPSLYEGFGLPVVEAQRLGCPVLCSDAASLPEVAGDGALFFDAKEPGAVVPLLEQLRSHPASRDDLVERGRQNAQRFRWSVSAQDVERVLGLAGGSDD